jgi:hypothetical protein
LRVYPNAYRLFNVAEPTRPPAKNIYQKETGLQKKVRGGFPCESLHRICEKNEGGGGVYL